MTLRIAIALALIAMMSGLTQPLAAETRACDVPIVSVTYRAEAHADLVCDAARQATEIFGQCNIPPLSRLIDVSIAEDLGQGCVGVNHCGADTIEVLSPAEMKKRRGPKSVFRHLPLEAYFKSIVVHELAHAATEGIPCPFEACVVAHEYIAYTAQVLSLDAQALAAFEKIHGPEAPVSSYDLSALILFLSPNLFARNVWDHFSRREDPCGYLGQIVDGTILLDAEHF